MKPNILDEAKLITAGGRQDEYGHPFHDFNRIATMWSAYLGVPVTAEQVAICQVLLKASRLAHSPGHHDSLVDIAGYARCAEMVRDYNDAPTNFERDTS